MGDDKTRGANEMAHTLVERRAIVKKEVIHAATRIARPRGVKPHDPGNMAAKKIRERKSGDCSVFVVLSLNLTASLYAMR